MRQRLLYLIASLLLLTPFQAHALTPLDCTEAHFASLTAFNDPDLTLTPVRIANRSHYMYASDTDANGPCAPMTRAYCIAHRGTTPEAWGVNAAEILQDGDDVCLFFWGLKEPIWMKKGNVTEQPKPGLAEWYGQWRSGWAYLYILPQAQYAYDIQHADDGTSNAAKQIDEDTLSGMQDNPIDLTKIQADQPILIGYDWYGFDGPNGRDVNSGFISGGVERHENMIVYYDDGGCAVVVVNLSNVIMAREFGLCGGHNTSFNGLYTRIASPF